MSMRIKIKEAFNKVAALALVVIMATSLVACGDKNKGDGSNVDNATVNSSSQATSTDNSDKTDSTDNTADSTSNSTGSTDGNGMAVSDEMPMPNLEGASNIETDKLAWVKSHNASDFNVNDLREANMVYNFVEPGSGKAIVTTRKIYGTDENGKNTGELLMYTDFYRWIGEDGTVYWYRDTHGFDFDSYVVIKPEGVAYRYNWKSSDPTSHIAYVNPDQIKNSYSMCPVFESSKLPDGAEAVKFNSSGADAEKYAKDAAYMVQIVNESENDEKMNVYLSNNMQMLAMLKINENGCSDFTTQYIVDELPDIESRMESFENMGLMENKLVLNGVETTIETIDMVQNMISVGVEGATITCDKVVYLDGEETNNITDGGRFLISEKATYTVNY